jgi:hypothetical protein
MSARLTRVALLIGRLDCALRKIVCDAPVHGVSSQMGRSVRRLSCLVGVDAETGRTIEYFDGGWLAEPWRIDVADTEAPAPLPRVRIQAAGDHGTV